MMPTGVLIGQEVKRSYSPLSSLHQQRQACEAIKSSGATAETAVGGPEITPRAYGAPPAEEYHFKSQFN